MGTGTAGKRPAMGEIAARLADVLVVTDDNPRTEDPALVREAMLSGAHAVPEGERAELHEVGDRRGAIRLAVARSPDPATRWWWRARGTRPGRRSTARCTRSTTATCCVRS